MGVLQKAETEWLAETVPEALNFCVVGSVAPMQLRRHLTIPGALAELAFGKSAFPRGIWLGMIVSEQPGQGRRLLDRIKLLADSHRLTIIGSPVPLKPTNWNQSRPWSDSEKDVTDWYVRNGFRAVAIDIETFEVIYP